MHHRELADRAIRNVGELTAALARDASGPDHVIRRDDALGGRLPGARGNPWFDAVFVPPAAVPPRDEPLLPTCVWTIGDEVAGRVEDPAIATPAFGVRLDRVQPMRASDAAIEEVSSTVLGTLNERAYDDEGMFGPLVRALRDERVRTVGVREGDTIVSVALTYAVDDDLGVHFVATDAAYRRRGLASGLLRRVLADARAAGMRSATLLASSDGASVYEALGFERVALLRGFVRAPAT